MCFGQKTKNTTTTKQKISNIKTLARAFADRHFQQIHFSVIFLNAKTTIFGSFSY